MSSAEIGTRWACSSTKEVWIQSCAIFFAKYGNYNWYLCDFDEAFRCIMVASKGRLNPHFVRKELKELYESVGIKID